MNPMCMHKTNMFLKLEESQIALDRENFWNNIEKKQRCLAPIRWPIYSGMSGRNTPEQVAVLKGKV